MHALTFNLTPGAWICTRAAAAVMGRRAYWGRFSAIKLTECPPPELPGPDWVLCKTRLGGICGTDLAMLRLQQQPDSFLQAVSSMPMIPGHENVAEVAEVHSSVDQAWVGKRVCVEPTLGCVARGIDPPCARCAQGEFGACENFGADGIGPYALPPGTSIGYNRRTGGSWGEYFVAHVSQLVEVPDALTDTDAAVTDPLACSVHAVLRADLTGVDTVCVLGGGAIGLGIVAGLRAVGFEGRIDLFARHNFQRELASRQGATDVFTEADAKDFDTIAGRLGGTVLHARFGNHMLMGGYDLVFDSVGSAACFTGAAKLARARGQVVLTGTSGAFHADTTPVWFRELTIRGAYGRQFEHVDGLRISTYELVHQWMLEGKLPTAGLLTHTFPLADYADAFAIAADKSRSSCVRAAFRFG